MDMENRHSLNGPRWLALICLTALISGCASGASDDSGAGPTADRTYGGLSGQSVAVMVWADWKIRADYAQAQLDLARLVQQRLEARTQATKNPEKTSGTRFINPGSVLRYIREHPDAEGLPAAEIAPKLGVSRLVHIELEEFEAQSPQSILLLKGTGKAVLRVVEVHAGRAKIVFEERDLKVNFPPNAPEGVTQSDKYNVRTIYEGTLIQMADRVAAHFKEKM
jgi:hypothetical protein